MRRFIFILVILFGFSTYCAQMSQMEERAYLSQKPSDELEQIILINKAEVIGLLNNLLEETKDLLEETKDSNLQYLQHVLDLVEAHQFHEAYTLLNNIKTLQSDEQVNNQISLILQYLQQLTEILSPLLSKTIETNLPENIVFPKDISKIIIDYATPFKWELYKDLLQRIGKQTKSEVYEVKFSPDGTKLASGDLNGNIIIWNTSTWEKMINLLKDEYGKTVQLISWSPDGTKLAAGYQGGEKVIWNVNNQTQLQNIYDLDSQYHVAWSPDGTKIAIENTEEVTILDASMSKILQTINESNFNYIIWSPDSSKIFIIDDGGNGFIYDVLTGKKLLTIEIFGGTGGVTSASWSPDGKYIAISNSKYIEGKFHNYINIFDAENGDIIKTLKGHQDYINSIAWSPDSKKIVSGSKDRTVRIWDVDTEKQINLLKGHHYEVTSVDWSSDGSTIASGSTDATVKIWRKNN